MSMSEVYKEQEVKRIRIVDLLRAQVPYKTIKEIVGVSLPTIWKVKKG